MQEFRQKSHQLKPFEDQSYHLAAHASSPQVLFSCLVKRCIHLCDREQPFVREMLKVSSEISGQEPQLFQVQSLRKNVCCRELALVMAGFVESDAYPIHQVHLNFENRLEVFEVLSKSLEQETEKTVTHLLQQRVQKMSDRFFRFLLKRFGKNGHSSSATACSAAVP